MSSKELQAALDVEQRRVSDPRIINRVIKEMQSSAVFKHNWGELLMAAPVAVSSLGAIFAASSTPVAARIMLSSPSGSKGGFKYLDNRYVWISVIPVFYPP